MFFNKILDLNEIVNFKILLIIKKTLILIKNNKNINTNTFINV